MDISKISIGEVIDATLAGMDEARERFHVEAALIVSINRSKPVETAWDIVDAIRDSWTGRPLTNREFYLAGTWGPTAADELLAADGREWKNPQPVR